MSPSQITASPGVIILYLPGECQRDNHSRRLYVVEVKEAILPNGILLYKSRNSQTSLLPFTNGWRIFKLNSILAILSTLLSIYGCPFPPTPASLPHVLSRTLPSHTRTCKGNCNLEGSRIPSILVSNPLTSFDLFSLSFSPAKTFPLRLLNSRLL